MRSMDTVRTIFMLRRRWPEVLGTKLEIIAWEHKLMYLSRLGDEKNFFVRGAQMKVVSTQLDRRIPKMYLVWVLGHPVSICWR